MYVVIYTELSLKKLVITQIYQVLFNLAPAIEVSFWKGMRLTAQLEVPIYNDGYPDMYNKIHPGFIGVSQTVRLPYNIWGTLTVGHFSSERYGVDMKISHRFIRDNRFGIEGRVGYKGSVEDTVFQLMGGLRSGMGYCGTHTVEELKENGRFVKISAASLKESHPHDIHITKEAPNYSVE